MTTDSAPIQATTATIAEVQAAGQQAHDAVMAGDEPTQEPARPSVDAQLQARAAEIDAAAANKRITGQTNAAQRHVGRAEGIREAARIVAQAQTAERAAYAMLGPGPDAHAPDLIPDDDASGRPATPLDTLRAIAALVASLPGAKDVSGTMARVSFCVLRGGSTEILATIGAIPEATKRTSLVADVAEPYAIPSWSARVDRVEFQAQTDRELTDDERAEVAARKPIAS